MVMMIAGQGATEPIDWALERTEGAESLDDHRRSDNEPNRKD